VKRKVFLISKAFNKYLWASILGVAASQIANIVDASLVGNIIGPDGLAAVVISKPVLQAIFAISCFYAVSCSMIAGMALGNGDRASANSHFSFSLVVSLVLGAVISVGGLVFIEPLLDLFCKSQELRPLAKSFMTVTILSATPQLFMYTLNRFVTTDGSPKMITRAVIVGNLFNVGLDIVFMKYLGMGIAGAAWATCIMYVVCCLMVLPHFRKKDTIRLAFGQFRKFISGKRIMTLGVPLFLSTALLSVQYACYNSISLTYLGKSGLVALAVCMQLFSFSMIILTGTLQTIQPVGAILRGNNDSKGMIMLLGKAYKFLFVCLAVYALLIVFFPMQISGFLGVKDGDAIPTVLAALPAFSLNIVMQALLYNLMPVYQFYNHHRMALFLSVGQTLLPIAGFWALAHFQLFNPWYGFFLGQVVTAVVLLFASFIICRKENSIPIFLVPRDSGCPSLEMSFGYSEDSMHKAFNEVSGWLKEQNLSKSTIFKVRIIAEELMSNITRHSEQKDKKAFADFRLYIREDAVVFTLTDNGKPFNPIEYKDKGYGLMIANGVASDISYKYQFGQNMTQVSVKKLDSTSR